jgi:hypothetical protein
MEQIKFKVAQSERQMVVWLATFGNDNLAARPTFAPTSHHDACFCPRLRKEVNRFSRLTSLFTGGMYET